MEYLLFCLSAAGVKHASNVYFSKGLEFDDILVLDFFGDSSRFRSWRVLYNFSQEDDAKAESRPEFDPRQHSGLIAELKLLYVAVTRARKRLCFLDSDPKKSRPFASLCRGLIETGPIDDFFNLDKGTTPAEWKAKGEQIFHEVGNFREARKCFRYAGDHEWELVAEAKLLSKAAQDNGGKQQSNSRDEMLRMTTIFGDLQLWLEHGDCLEEQGRFADAAQSYLKHANAGGTAAAAQQASEAFLHARELLAPHLAPDDKEVLRCAAVCFAKAQLWLDAIKQYASIKEWPSISQIIKQGSPSICLDALKVVRTHDSSAGASANKEGLPSERPPPDSTSNLVIVFPNELLDEFQLGAATHHIDEAKGAVSEAKLKQSRDCALEHIVHVDNLELKASFLCMHHFWRPLAEVYTTAGEHREAAVIYLDIEKLDEPLQAARCFLSAANAREGEALDAALKYLNYVKQQAPKPPPKMLLDEAIREVCSALEHRKERRALALEIVRFRLPRLVVGADDLSFLGDMERLVKEVNSIEDIPGQEEALRQAVDHLLVALPKIKFTVSGQVSSTTDSIASLEAHSRVFALSSDIATVLDPKSIHNLRERIKKSENDLHQEIKNTKNARDNLAIAERRVTKVEGDLKRFDSIARPAKKGKDASKEEHTNLSARKQKERAKLIETLQGEEAKFERGQVEVHSAEQNCALVKLGLEKLNTLEALTQNVVKARDCFLGELANQFAALVGTQLPASVDLETPLRQLARACFESGEVGDRVKGISGLSHEGEEPFVHRFWTALNYREALLNLARFDGFRRALLETPAALLKIEYNQELFAAIEKRLEYIVDQKSKNGALGGGMHRLVEGTCLAQCIGGQLPKPLLWDLMCVEKSQHRCRSFLAVRSVLRTVLDSVIGVIGSQKGSDTSSPTTQKSNKKLSSSSASFTPSTPKKQGAPVVASSTPVVQNTASRKTQRNQKKKEQREEK